jgi:opacity protein-like surface antigen
MFAKRMVGTTVWADWNFDRAPSFLRGFSVEAEVRDLDHGQPQGQKLRQGTAGGGPLYTWRHFSNFHPYGKFLVNLGAMDHIKNARLPSWYQGDIWTIYACGGGVDYRVHQSVWLRTDYEYQFWRVKFFNPNSFLNPQGFTVGVSYDFSRTDAH